MKRSSGLPEKTHDPPADEAGQPEEHEAARPGVHPAREIGGARPSQASEVDRQLDADEERDPGEAGRRGEDPAPPSGHPCR